MSLEALSTLLQQLEDTPGKLDKQALLKGADPKLVPMLKEYLSIAMDWYRIYGLAEKSLAKFANEDFDGEKVPYSWRQDKWEVFKRYIATLEALEGTPNDAFKRELALVLLTFPQDQRKWLQRALLKNVNIGVSEKTVNKIWPKLINIFEIQLADKCETPEDATFPCSVEPKLDGIRAICLVDLATETCKFLSRGGQPLHNTVAAGIDKCILKSLAKSKEKRVVFDGELYTGNFNESQSITSDESPDADKIALIPKLKYYIFDMLTWDEWDNQKCSRPLFERRNAIPFHAMSTTNAPVVKTIETRVIDVDQLKGLSELYLSQGFEGVMVKDPDGLYVYKRSKAWKKLKPVDTEDFKVVGITEGVKKKTIGKVASLVLDLGDGKTCEVGSGLTDEMREDFMKKPPIGVYAEIKFKMRTPDGLLREPILVRMRPDKKD